MKFKSISNDPEAAVETVVIQTVEIECSENIEDVDKKESKKQPAVFADFFEHLQQKMRIYGCFQIYFNKNGHHKTCDHFRQLEYETKRHIELLFMVFDGTTIPALPEISFDFEDNKEPFQISEKLEEETAKFLQKIFEDTKDNFVKMQWLNEFKIFKTLALAKKLAKENKDEFCDKSLGQYSRLCEAVC